MGDVSITGIPLQMLWRFFFIRFWYSALWCQLVLLSRLVSSWAARDANRRRTDIDKIPKTGGDGTNRLGFGAFGLHVNAPSLSNKIRHLRNGGDALKPQECDRRSRVSLAMRHRLLYIHLQSFLPNPGSVRAVTLSFRTLISLIFFTYLLTSTGSKGYEMEVNHAVRGPQRVLWRPSTARICFWSSCIHRRILSHVQNRNYLWNLTNCA